jgi:hypothetical protein
MRACIAIVLTGATMGIACSHGPTAPPPTSSGLVVKGVAPAIGWTTQFVATATLSDGTSRDATAIATWTTSNGAVVTVSTEGLVTGIDPGEADVQAAYQGFTGSVHIAIAPPQCDQSLWSHVYIPTRLKIRQDCETVAGVVMEQHSNDDGDIDIRVSVDPPYARLLNGANLTNLNGLLQTEAICQARFGANALDPQRACGGFKGTVPVPPIGARVVVTGTYVLDTNHGWMELHPITLLAIR